ncbi:MAG: PEP-CTERM sorting domain-containing protein [Betaproteobacteria bacterium]|nr:PEP-CTERM sorting domain-containing protein [Betaproteobacteria bacterium]
MMKTHRILGRCIQGRLAMGRGLLSLVLAGGVLAGAAASGPALGGVIDPQIFVQQSGSSPAGGDPNLIVDPGVFVVGVAGNFVLQNPLLLIVGAYNGMGTPSITYGGGVSAAAIGTYGLTKDSAVYTGTSSGTAYSQLGLSAGGSESFGNWSNADVADGFAKPSSFTLYAFALDTNLTSGNPITVGESGAANGSFIIGYDCSAGTGSTSGCATRGDIGQTPFTNAGLDAVTVPDPGTPLLVGIGALGMGAAVRRRRTNGIANSVA